MLVFFLSQEFGISAAEELEVVWILALAILLLLIILVTGVSEMGTPPWERRWRLIEEARSG